MRRACFSAAAAAAVLVVLLSSCQSMQGGATPDERAIAKGVTAWNEKEPSAARPFWGGIKDKTARETYTGYVDGFEAGSRSLADARAAKPAEEARIQSSYDKARRSFSGLPKDLALPEEIRAGGIAVAEVRMRALINADRLSAAREMGKGAAETFGGSDAISSMNAEIDVISASRGREAGADSALAKAREIADFDSRIEGLDAASAAYSRAETALSTDAAKARVTKAQGVAVEAARLRTKRQTVEVERERMIREQAYALKDRIGAEFARAPEKEKVGNMSLEELLAFQESVKANVNAAYADMTRFAARYPDAVDPVVIEEADAQKKVLDEKIAQVNAEIRTAREIESRGKVVMPVMIGLFNPQPGSTAEAKKSRPAVFQASGVKKNDYWWGMVSIPRGVMNDLVVTVNDSRPVRVFTDNTKSGSLIEKNKMKDLVNRGYKVGNSWPVLNAGSQLPTDKYFFEVQQGKTPDYTGEVTVYSSFIMRMR